MTSLDRASETDEGCIFIAKIRRLAYRMKHRNRPPRGRGQALPWDRPEAGVKHTNDGSGELRIFLNKIGLSVRFTILSVWICCSVMNLLSTKLHRKLRRAAARARSHAARGRRNTVSRRPKCGRKGRPEPKNLEAIKGRLENL